VTEPVVFADVATARRIERAEAAMTAAIVESLRHRSGAYAHVESVGAGYAIFAGPGSPLNKVIGVGLGPGSLDEEALDRAERTFAEHNAALRAEVSVLASPDVFVALARRGYRFETVEHVLGLRVAAGGPVLAVERGTVAVARVERAAANEWTDVLVNGFAVPDVTESGVTGEVFTSDVLREAFSNFDGVDRFRRYLASVGGRVAGGGGLYLGDGIAFLCGAATLPAFRRQGVQGALLRARLAEAALAGCDLAVVTTAPGSTSQQNVQRHGFSLLYARAVLVRSPSRETAGSG
jgi:ribosomal protein S18 acetylase RimI-like enzyme